MSLERNCEQVMIELLSSDPMLAAMNPMPRDRDASRRLPQIVVSALKGERQYEGPEAFEVAGTVELRVNFKDVAADKLDAIWTAIENALERQIGLKPETAQKFSYLQINRESQSARESEDDSRLRSRTYPLLATPA